MSKETIKILEINTDPAKKSIKDLRKELMELKNQMANLEEGGDEFLEIANKAGELKHQLDEINESVKGASVEVTYSVVDCSLGVLMVIVS